jgi:hypothetical protein
VTVEDGQVGVFVALEHCNAARNLEELRQALLEFKERYNEHWLIERNGFRSPRQVRRDFLALGAAA